MIEIFKDIKGYEGLYQVSNLGNVKSLVRNIILKPTINRGYFSINLHKEGKRKTVYIHRLVAEAFIPNPDNLPYINHKSEIKTQNNVENLEWCTPKYNVNYGARNAKCSTPIKCLDLETNETSYYPSIIEAARQLNVSSSAVIWHSIYKWKRPYKNRFIFSEINNKK